MSHIQLSKSTVPAPPAVAIGLATAQTTVTRTVNSAGLSLNADGFLSIFAG